MVCRSGGDAGRGSNQGNTQNKKSPYYQSFIDSRCYLELARFEPRTINAWSFCSGQGGDRARGHVGPCIGMNGANRERFVRYRALQYIRENRSILARTIGRASRMASGFGGVLVAALWISLAVVGAHGVAVGGWRVMGGRAWEGLGLLLTGSTAFVLFALLGVVMR